MRDGLGSVALAELFLGRLNDAGAGVALMLLAVGLPLVAIGLVGFGFVASLSAGWRYRPMADSSR